MYVGELLTEGLQALAGERYKRNGTPGYVRWTKQSGSVYLGDEKLPIRYQRVRDRRKGREVELTAYKRLQQPRRLDEGLLTKIIIGLSCRRYRECSEAIPEAFSLSPSAVSRRFTGASATKLRELMERRLDSHDILALVIDGKRFAEDEMIIALGLT